MINIKEKIHNQKQAISLCNLILKSGGEVRFIGGCVRDMLLNKAFSDIDLATNLTPEEVQNILEHNKIKYYTIGKEFGTITAIANKQSIEITTLRKDTNCDGRYAKVEFTDSWIEDAQRRDFTINALSADINGNIYDYFNGLEDLKSKKVRFIGIADDRIQEDYLRILRFFRFSSYFTDKIDEDGLKASIKHSNHLKNISSERIKSELSKIFNSSNWLYIIKAMDPVLKNIFPYKERTIESIEKLTSSSLMINNNHEIIIYAIILYNCPNSKELIKNYAFTKQEKAIIEKLLKSQIKDWSNSLKQYWCEYKNLFKEVAIFNLIIQNIDLNNSLLTSNLEKLFSHPIEMLPITGNDLLDLGIKNGKEIGKTLKLADQIWYDQEFNISKEQLLKKILL
jgi:poly(A) polymerase